MFANQTLAAMDPGDLAVLLPHLTERDVDRGEILIAQGDRVDSVAFPSTAYLANTVTFSDGRSADTFVMGSEGVSGLAPFLANEPCPWTVEVRSPGRIYEIPGAALRRAIEASPGLRALMLKRASDYQAQAALGVACAALHPATGRLALFLLKISARADADQVRFTQEDMAAMLGFQRTTVNASAKELKAAGTIDYSRGRIRIVDPAGLRRLACECARLGPWPAT